MLSCKNSSFARARYYRNDFDRTFYDDRVYGLHEF